MVLIPLAFLLLAPQTSPPDCGPDLPAGARCVPKAGEAVPVGRTIQLRLDRDAVLQVEPDRAPAAGTFAGARAFQIARAGAYEVWLSGPVWIDIARDGRKMASIAHRHGDASSPFRKIVTFRLEPGRYLLQLSGAKATAVQLGIFPAP